MAVELAQLISPCNKNDRSLLVEFHLKYLYCQKQHFLDLSFLKNNVESVFDMHHVDSENWFENALGELHAKNSEIMKYMVMPEFTRPIQ